MIKMNENFLKLKASYLFSEIGKRVRTFQEANPEKEIIKLGIGDVTCPLPESCIKALHSATDEMAREDSFHGYGPEEGYEFLRSAIAKNEYQNRGAQISADEIIISDGSKCDTGNFQELFADDIKIGVPDPVYPVYVDTNVMAGRTGQNIEGRYEGLYYLESTEKNNFVPEPPVEKLDLIYLCFPNNPTGMVASKEQLEKWVAYAKANKALILYDAAYVAFIRNPDIPQSIFEIEGAKEVAVEFRSFSKTAGFTGTRCAFTVIPKECKIYDNAGNAHDLHALWLRRHCTKFNGVSYPIQKAAAAVYSETGQKEVKDLIDYYMENAQIIKAKMTELGYKCFGGADSPYIWIKSDLDSWEFFDMLLEKAGVVCTPGAGFGKCGEGYIRISAFNSKENVKKAMEKISALKG